MGFIGINLLPYYLFSIYKIGSVVTFLMPDIDDLRFLSFLVSDLLLLWLILCVNSNANDAQVFLEEISMSFGGL